MKTIIVKDDKGNENSFSLTNYEINHYEDYLVLTLALENASNIQYCISVDPREPNLFVITDYINGLLGGTEEGCVMFREFFARNYLFIGDQKMDRQFTAHRDIFLY